MSNSVPDRSVLNRAKIDGKCHNSKILTFLCMIPNPIRIFQEEICFRVVRAAAQSAVFPSDFGHNFRFGGKD